MFSWLGGRSAWVVIRSVTSKGLLLWHDCGPVMADSKEPRCVKTTSPMKTPVKPAPTGSRAALVPIAATSALTLAVDRDLQLPIYLQICQRFKTAIAQGHLRPGDRVPAVRGLASELNLARGTVEAAYRLLADEGYLLVRGAAGTVVSPTLINVAEQKASTFTPPAQPILRTKESVSQPLIRPFQMGLPALDAFPRKLWNRIVARRLRSGGVAHLTYPDMAGYWPLRERVATYLGLSRGVVCSPEQVFITAGYRAALELILRALYKQGDQIWFEDPGYMNARKFLSESGVNLVPVPVDQDGLMVEQGRRLAPDARFALVTPSHQSPLGVTLSLERRMALLEWAGAGARKPDQRSWIIEDDYDSEYRYLGRPLPALKSLDREDRVIYTGTFSKVMFPGLRLAYVVAPAGEVERFQRSCASLQASCPYLFQASVADFMAEGHFSRHLKKMRTLYAHRRAITAQALLQVFGDRMKIDLQAGGMHLLATLQDGEDDAAITDRAQALGLAPHGLSRFCIAAQRAPGLVMGFTNIVDADHALRVARQLKRAFD
jgi:GntR family transcriptional regulator/MocR family aminotransferase